MPSLEENIRSAKRLCEKLAGCPQEQARCEQLLLRLIALSGHDLDDTEFTEFENIFCELDGLAQKCLNKPFSDFIIDPTPTKSRVKSPSKSRHQPITGQFSIQQIELFWSNASANVRGLLGVIAILVGFLSAFKAGAFDQFWPATLSTPLTATASTVPPPPTPTNHPTFEVQLSAATRPLTACVGQPMKAWLHLQAPEMAPKTTMRVIWYFDIAQCQKGNCNNLEILGSYTEALSYSGGEIKNLEKTLFPFKGGANFPGEFKVFLAGIEQQTGHQVSSATELEFALVDCSHFP